MTVSKMPDTAHCCANCGSFRIQVGLPAWHDPNNNWQYLETDIEAHPLWSYCGDCEDHYYESFQEDDERWEKFLAWKKENTPPSVWDEDPDFPVADWKYEVANDNTRQSYREWVRSQRKPAKDDVEGES